LIPGCILFFFPVDYLLSGISIDIVIGNHQQEQEDAQDVGENGQLHVGDHFAECLERFLIN